MKSENSSDPVTSHLLLHWEHAHPDHPLELALERLKQNPGILPVLSRSRVHRIEGVHHAGVADEFSAEDRALGGRPGGSRQRRKRHCLESQSIPERLCSPRRVCGVHGAAAIAYPAGGQPLAPPLVSPPDRYSTFYRLQKFPGRRLCSSRNGNFDQRRRRVSQGLLQCGRKCIRRGRPVACHAKAFAQGDEIGVAQL